MAADPPPLEIRSRRAADLPVLLALLQYTHEHAGYPVRASAVRADWLAAADELLGAVAAHDGRVVGHVALHPTAPPGHDAGQDAASTRWQQATGAPTERLAVVSRLVTDRTVPGAGVALLAHVVWAAAQLGRIPVLLVDPDSGARDFYLRHGWREIGTATQQWGHRRVEAALMVLAEGQAPPVSRSRTSQACASTNEVSVRPTGTGPCIPSRRG